MLHGYEEATYVPAISLYDSGMMLQMVAAARELYLQGLKDLDDFYKTYGDFLSPSLADMNYYYDNTVGSIRDMFNYALAHGIDLLRSAEGRAMVANVRRNIPYAKLAAIRLNAKDLDTYNKLVALEKANGTYMNDEVQAMLNGGFNPKDFSTIGPDGRILMVGTRTPYRIRDLKTVSQPYFDGRTPGELSKEEVESFGIPYDSRYNYTGFTKAQLLDIANGFDTTTPEGKAYFYMARKQVQDAANASGQNLTEDQLNKAARQVLAKQIADANIEYLVRPEKKADSYASADYGNKLKKDYQKWVWDNTPEDFRPGYAAKLKASGSGEGGRTGNTEIDLLLPILGSYKQIKLDHNINYAKRISGLYDEYNKSTRGKQYLNTQLNAYSKLNERQRAAALRYAKLYDGGIKTKDDAKFVKSFESNRTYSSWLTAFKNRRQDREAYVDNKTTTQGMMLGRHYTNAQLAQVANKVWSDNFEIEPPSGDQKRKIDAASAYTNEGSKNGMTIWGGTMNKFRSVANIQLQRDTGNRRFGNNADGAAAYALSRILKGKHFQVTPSLFATRRYGIVGNKLQLIDVARFDISDKDDKNIGVNQISAKDRQWITKNAGQLAVVGAKIQEETGSDGKSHRYLYVPIMTQRNFGQAEAWSDALDIKSIGGTTAGSEYTPNEQASYAQQLMNSK